MELGTTAIEIISVIVIVVMQGMKVTFLDQIATYFDERIKGIAYNLIVFVLAIGSFVFYTSVFGITDSDGTIHYLSWKMVGVNIFSILAIWWMSIGQYELASNLLAKIKRIKED